jgi:hypothetical protein
MILGGTRYLAGTKSSRYLVYATARSRFPVPTERPLSPLHIVLCDLHQRGREYRLQRRLHSQDNLQDQWATMTLCSQVASFIHSSSSGDCLPTIPHASFQAFVCSTPSHHHLINSLPSLHVAQFPVAQAFPFPVTYLIGGFSLYVQLGPLERARLLVLRRTS